MSRTGLRGWFHSNTMLKLWGLSIERGREIKENETLIDTLPYVAVFYKNL